MKRSSFEQLSLETTDSEERSTTDESTLFDSEEEELPVHFMADQASTSQAEQAPPSDGEEEVLDEVNLSERQNQPQLRATHNPKFTAFTLNDIPPSQWRQRFQEFKAWILIEA